MTLKHVVVGGGTGYIGSCICTALHNLNVKTTIISRMPGPKRMSWQELEVNGLPKDVSAVINVAGQNILNFSQRWTPGLKQNVFNSRVKTTQQLAKAVANSDAKAFVTISGVAYYPLDGKEYTEYDKCQKYDFLSGLCHDWEAAAQLPKDSSARQVIIRSGVVLGRTGGMINQCFIPFFVGFGGLLGSGTQYMPWIHIKDLVNLFIYALNNECIRGVYNGVAPQLITNAEFTKTFASSLSKPAFIDIPAFVLKTLIHEERVKVILEGQKVHPKRVLESEFKYKYPTIKEACDQFGIFLYKEEY